MIVLEYFLDKMAVFMPPMDQKAALAAWDDEEVYDSISFFSK